MDCNNCHMPLEINARFCRSCGSPVSMPVQQQQSTMPYQPNQLDHAPTIPTLPWQPQPAQQGMSPQYVQPTQNVSPQQNVPVAPQPGTFQQPPMYLPGTLQQGPPSQPGAYQQGPPSQPGMIQQGPPSQPGAYQQGPLSQPGAYQQQAPVQPAALRNDEPRKLAAAGNVPPKRKRRGRRFLIGLLVTLVVLVALILGGWFIAARPYLHNLAATQISTVLTNGINQIPPAAAQAPANTNFAVQENVLNNLITLETAPSDPVQHMQIQIAPTGMTINFQVYGFGCTVSGIPAANNGHLIVTNVNVQGLASLIMSSDELTTLLDQKLADAQAKLDHPILGVQLKNQEIDLLLGPPGSV